MIQINNQEKFEQVVSSAICAAIQNASSDQLARRWENAINRAVTEIESNPFLDFDAQTNVLLICSPSNNIYSANGICQCRAFTEFKVPCWHRAAARLVRLYFEAAASTAREDERAVYITPKLAGETAKVGGFRL